MFKTIRRKIKEDRAASALVSFMFVVPIFLGVIASGLDLSFYFVNRGNVEAVARDAARTIGIYGGNGNSKQRTVIEAKYGRNACATAVADVQKAPNKIFYSQIRAGKDLTSAECAVAVALANNTGFTSVTFDKKVNPANGVKCGPDSANAIGARTYCSITYTYEGIPGSPLSWLRFIDADTKKAVAPLAKNVVTKSSESEVKNPGLVSR